MLHPFLNYTLKDMSKINYFQNNKVFYFTFKTR